MFEVEVIQPEILYVVSGSTASIVYSGATYNSGENFRGVYGQTGFTPTNSPTIFEITELRAGAIEFATNDLDKPVFDQTTQIEGMAVEFSLNEEEKVVNETTEIKGFSLEFLYFSPYVFQITKH